MNVITGFIALAAAKRRGGSPPAGYTFRETFEGSQVDTNAVAGYDNTGWGSYGTADPRYATSPAPLEGSFSCAPGTADPFHCIYHDFTAANEIYVAPALTGPGFSLGRALWLRDNAGANNLLIVEIAADGTINVTCGSSSASSSSGAFTSGSYQRLWARYRRSTGSDGIAQVWVDSDDTIPGSPVVNITNHDETRIFENMALFGGDGAFVWDDVIVSTSLIGDVT